MSNRRITKAATHKIGTYDLINKFNGYRAREDKTNLDPNTLIQGSQNVVYNTAGRLALVKGYVVDGDASTVPDSGILSNFDFTNFKGDRRNLRCGFQSASGVADGKLQYRFRSATDVISWVNLKTSLSNVVLSFCEYWDNTNLVKNVLWVDGTDNVYAWNGAVTTFASATVNTVTKQGTRTWAQEGFSATGSIVINGVPATYTGGSTTTTLTGVSVDYSAYTVAQPVHQEVVTTALSAMTSILATFGPTVIGCGRQNQVYLGSSSSNILYISKVNDYKNYAFTSPTRVVGEGASIPLDFPPVAFLAQENENSPGSAAVSDMWISEGQDQWSIIRSTLSADLTKETLQRVRLKTAPLQGAFSSRAAVKMKNHIVYLANDKTVNALGYVSDQNVPVVQDLSYPIVDDQNAYTFTNCSLFYHKNYVYETVPLSGLIRVYNMTDQTKQQFSRSYATEQVSDDQPWFWEAPVTYPIAGFYIDDEGNLCGHGFATSESYTLFTGGSFNGQDITAQAVFAYNDLGDRASSKGSDEVWVEGYIKQNTDLECTIAGDLDSFRSTQTVTIEGDNEEYVAYGAGANAIGKNHLGASPIGGSFADDELPAWFHVAKTYPQVPCYLEQIQFYSKGVDLQWELITFGTNATMTVEGNNDITD